MRLLAPILAAAALVYGCGTTTTAVANEFSLQLPTSAQTVTLPATSTTATFTVNTGLISGVAESIALSISGLPSGVTGAFNPATLTGAGSSTLTLTVESTAAGGSTTFTVTGTAASETQTATASLDVCVPGPVTLAVTQQAQYNCGSPAYMGTFTVTNKSCAAVNVTQLLLTGATTQCTPSGTSTYNLTAVVGVGQSVDVLPLTGSAYCCTTSPCSPSMPSCVEDYSYSMSTSAGTLTAPDQDVTISLAGCETVQDGGTVGFCPP